MTEHTTAEGPQATDESFIDFSDFTKVQMHVGEILASDRVPETDKLLVSQVRVGDRTMQIVSGIAHSYEPEQLPGKKVVVVTNLKPATLRGVLSEGMLLAATNEEGKPILVTVEQDIPSGCPIY